MKLNFTKLLFAIFAIMLFIPTTFAKEQNIYYTNSKGVQMTQAEYEKLSQHFTDYDISSMKQDRFERLINAEDIHVEPVVKEYFATTTYKNPDGTTFSTERTITENEYNSFKQTSNLRDCNYGELCYETNAKILWTFFSEYTYSGNKYIEFHSGLVWKYIPNVKSYDVFASRWSDTNSKITYDYVEGVQYVDYVAANGEINWSNAFYYDSRYPSQSNNINTAANLKGVGISMNIVDQMTLPPVLEKWVTLQVTGNTNITYYLSYQHATSSVTLAQSKSYTFSSSGLGGVVYFSNSTIRNKYDGMSGINLTYSVGPNKIGTRVY